MSIIVVILHYFVLLFQCVSHYTIVKQTVTSDYHIHYGIITLYTTPWKFVMVI